MEPILTQPHLLSQLADRLAIVGSWKARFVPCIRDDFAEIMVEMGQRVWHRRDRPLP
jgi:hypothetical protein